MKTNDRIFRITCSCGAELTGTRHAVTQIRVCSQCGQKHAVPSQEPSTPLPQATRAVAAPPPPPPSASASPSWRFWAVPVLAALLTSLLLLCGYSFFWTPQPVQVTREEHPKAVPQFMEKVLALLHQGQFHLARTEIDNVRTAVLETATPREQRRWRQLQRETALYADLSSASLEELLRDAAETVAPNWEAEFAVRHRGKAIIFDADVERRGGKLRLAYDVPTEHGPAELVIDNLKVFDGLDIDVRRRVFFGARLASFRLEMPGPRWFVRFVDDSGVLLTDGAAAAQCCPTLADNASQERIRAQAME